VNVTHLTTTAFLYQKRSPEGARLLAEIYWWKYYK